MSGVPKEKTDNIPEITPEMIEAGAWALVTHDPEHYSLDEIVESIGRAMLQAKSKGSGRSDDRHIHPSDC